MIRKKWLVLTVTVLLVFGLMASVAVADGNGLGPVTKSTGKDAATFTSANQWWPNSAWDNPYSEAYADAIGKVNMIQPNGNVDVILAVSVDGLEPDRQYHVWIDTNGVEQNKLSTHGPFLGNSFVDTFYADEFGKGEWNRTTPAREFEAGEYTYSVYIVKHNIPSVGNKTVLISENIEFAVE